MLICYCDIYNYLQQVILCTNICITLLSHFTTRKLLSSIVTSLCSLRGILSFGTFLKTLKLIVLSRSEQHRSVDYWDVAHKLLWFSSLVLGAPAVVIIAWNGLYSSNYKFPTCGMRINHNKLDNKVRHNSCVDRQRRIVHQLCGYLKVEINTKKWNSYMY